MTGRKLLKSGDAVDLIDSEVANEPHFAANTAVPAEFAGFPTAERFISNLEINKDPPIAAMISDEARSK